MENTFDLKKESNLFLVPEMPTPNGRMHLGHISGPYLKMDILKRKAIRNGATAYLVSGSDVYESYVELKADQTGKDVEDICNFYHDLIQKDYAALNIEMDFFINPLESTFLSDFHKQHKALTQKLIDGGFVEEREEVFPYDENKDRFLTGCWLSGTCPNCNTPTGSYLCENCGTHYKPSDIFDGSEGQGIKLLKRKSLFLKLDAPLMKQKLKEMGVYSGFREIFDRYIELQGPYVRLTTEQKTGVAAGPENQVLYTYTSLWFFSLFCGDVAKEKFGLAEHPFAPNSSFTTIASFGIDNAIPYLGGVLGAGLSTPDFKAFDHLLSNYFYYLNGNKFSTSRLHVIWGKDIVEKSGVSPDLVRYYLTQVNPEFESQNFDLKDFITTINQALVEEHNAAIDFCSKLLEAGTKATSIAPEWKTKINTLLTQQNETLNPATIHLKAFSDTINDWLTFFNENKTEMNADKAYWWLKTYALLASPVLTEMCDSIWNILGETGAINFESFFEPKTVSNQKPTLFEAVSMDKMLHCLPEHLSNEIIQN